MKFITLVLFLVISINTLSSGGATGTGGGPTITPDANRLDLPIDNENNNLLGLGDTVTFNPSYIKNIQMNDGGIIGMNQLINPVREDVLVDMSDYYKLHQMGVNNFELNSGEIILVEPEGFYID